MIISQTCAKLHSTRKNPISIYDTVSIRNLLLFQIGNLSQWEPDSQALSTSRTPQESKEILGEQTVLWI